MRDRPMPRPRILIVEDEKALADLVAYNLRREGYEVATAAAGGDGLKKPKPMLPNAAILTFWLPRWGGKAVCKPLRPGDRPPPMRFLLLPANSRRPTRWSGSRSGPTTT